MKKFFTLIAAAAVTATVMAAPSAKIDQEGLTYSLKPEYDQMLNRHAKGVNEDLTFKSEGKQLKRMWIDVDQKVKYTISVAMQGPVIDIYQFTNAQGQIVDYTLEEIPYYGVTFEVVREALEENGLPRLYSGWVLWWPSKYEWMDFVDRVADGTYGQNQELDLSAAPFDALCNIHENELFPEFGYCSKFTEPKLNSEGKPTLPFPTFNTYTGSDGKEYYDLEHPTAVTWGMEFWGASLNYEEATSGIKAGNPSVIDFESWSPSDQWLEVNCRLFTNGTNRTTFNYSGRSRVQGWDVQFLDYPEIGSIHAFNAGEVSSDYYGDTDVYGVKWGPLQKYWLFGTGKYFEIAENYWEGEFDRSKVKVQPTQEAADLAAEGKLNIYDEENYFYGSLFCAPGADLDAGVWEMLAPYQVGTTDTYTVKPEAGTMAPYGLGNTANIQDGWIAINRGDIDVFVAGSKAALGTVKGFQAWMNNGYNMYQFVYDKDIILHYDPKDMTKTKLISTVGTLGELIPDAVEEIEVSDVAPVYYNLQGVRVANPEKGLYIKVQGNKSSKVVF